MLLCFALVTERATARCVAKSDLGVVVFQSRILQLLWAWKFSLTLVESNALWLLLPLLAQKSIAVSPESVSIVVVSSSRNFV